MERISIGIHETDRNGLYSLRPEFFQNARKAGEIDGLAYSPLVGNSLWHLPAQVAGDEWLRLRILQIEEIGAFTAADLKNVSKPFGCEQANLYAFSLSDGIDDYRCAVDKGGKFTRRNMAGGNDIQHAFFKLGWG